MHSFKMFGFIKSVFFTGLAFLSTLTRVNLLSYISMDNKECKVRPQVVNINRDEPVFFSFSLKTSQCSGGCSNMNDPYAKLCVPDVVKTLNAEVFYLMSRTNKTRRIERHETFKCKCRLDASVFNNKKRWNDGKCRCKCKELIDKGVCDKGSIWNASDCEFKCDKSFDFREYLDYENCKCREKLIDKLVDKCTENNNEVNIAERALFEHDNESVYSYTICVVLAVIVSTISIGFRAYFTYKYINCIKETGAKQSFNYQTKLPY